MKKELKKKLLLNKETVSSLNHGEMQEVLGGATNTPSFCKPWLCQTDWCTFRPGCNSGPAC